MPVEIKELVIRAVATEGSSSGDASAGKAVSADQQALVEACVRRVLKILKQTKER